MRVYIKIIFAILLGFIFIISVQDFLVPPVFADDSNPGLAVSIDEFEQQMIYFTEHGYNAMFLRDIHLYLINKRPLPEKTIIITFDDGYKSFHSLVYPVLKKLNLKASVAVIAHSMDENWDYYYISWQQAQEMNKSGLVEVVSHTSTHKALPTLCPKQLSEEITISDKTIGKYLCYESNILVYPGGAYNNNTISAVKKEYKLGVTIMEGINTFGTNPFIVKRFKVFHGNTGEDLEKRFAI